MLSMASHSSSSASGSSGALAAQTQHGQNQTPQQTSTARESRPRESKGPVSYADRPSTEEEDELDEVEDYDDEIQIVHKAGSRRMSATPALSASSAGPPSAGAGGPGTALRATTSFGDDLSSYSYTVGANSQRATPLRAPKSSATRVSTTSTPVASSSALPIAAGSSYLSTTYSSQPPPAKKSRPSTATPSVTSTPAPSVRTTASVAGSTSTASGKTTATATANADAAKVPVLGITVLTRRREDLIKFSLVDVWLQGKEPSKRGILPPDWPDGVGPMFCADFNPDGYEGVSGYREDMNWDEDKPEVEWPFNKHRIAARKQAEAAAAKSKAEAEEAEAKAAANSVPSVRTGTAGAIRAPASVAGSDGDPPEVAILIARRQAAARKRLVAPKDPIAAGAAAIDEDDSPYRYEPLPIKGATPLTPSALALLKQRLAHETRRIEAEAAKTKKKLTKAVAEQEPKLLSALPYPNKRKRTVLRPTHEQGKFNLNVTLEDSTSLYPIVSCEINPPLPSDPLPMRIMPVAIVHLTAEDSPNVTKGQCRSHFRYVLDRQWFDRGALLSVAFEKGSEFERKNRKGALWPVEGLLRLQEEVERVDCVLEDGGLRWEMRRR